MTIHLEHDLHLPEISIHTFLAEGDRARPQYSPSILHFNPHLPRGRWRRSRIQSRSRKNFNPHLPRGRWQIVIALKAKDLRISIHTFLAEGDSTRTCSPFRSGHFNPHLPRGRWLYVDRAGKQDLLFQSTPSSRKVTQKQDTVPIKKEFQSTPSSRKVTCKMSLLYDKNHISIHTFLAEGDKYTIREIYDGIKFQSTPSSRKVTV